MTKATFDEELEKRDTIIDGLLAAGADFNERELVVLNLKFIRIFYNSGLAVRNMFFI